METPVFFKHARQKNDLLVRGHIVSDSTRCVQCGICTYNCPVNIDVRHQVWHRIPMKNNQCLACGECVKRCPRGVLRFAETDTFSKRKA